jgi:hypothetical protein
MNQWPQFLGAFLLLAAYALAQSGRLNVSSLGYSMANVVGSLLLAIDAYRAQQWGFVLLEGAWFLFTMPSLRRAWRARRAADPA